MIAADAQAEALTRRWLRDCVLALELCPFAAPVVADDSLRIACSDARDDGARLQDFLTELDLLQASPEQAVSTTLLVFSAGDLAFDAFLDLLDAANELVTEAGLEGLVQLASFHPDYRFDGEDADDPSHYTNRSPFPVLHLLREDMMTRALLDFPDPAAIPARNIERLRDMGIDAVRAHWAALAQD